MTSRPNPYTPGAGDRPRALVGRSDQLALAQSLRNQIEASYSANCLIFTGLRGVGKTVVLKEITERFTEHGWFAPYVEIRRRADVDTALAGVTARAAENLPAKSKLRKCVGDLQRRGGGLQILGTGASLGAGTRSGGYETLSQVLGALGEAARDDGTGVALVVDELQSLTLTSLGELVHLVQDLRDRVPLAFLGAGLPHLPGYIAKAATYTERFRYEPMDFLAPPDARLAVREPAEAEGVVWEAAALDRLIEVAGGYPYFLQLYASETWNEAARASDVTVLTEEHLHVAVPVVGRLLDVGLYTSRFDQTRAPEREYLYAMLRLIDKGEDPGGRVRSGRIAEEMDRTVHAVSPTRDSLLRRGLIHAPEHGVVEFSIPGFVDYLRRRIGAGDDGE